MRVVYDKLGKRTGAPPFFAAAGIMEGKSGTHGKLKEKEQKEAAQSEEREAYSHEEQEVII